MGEIATLGSSEVRGIDVPGVLTAISWRLPKGLSVEQWTISGSMINRIEGAVQWWLGDWWIYGESRQYGDGQELAERISVDYGTIRDYGWVAGAFELSRRRDNLSFGHHREVAALPAKQQNKWLDRAEQEDLSVMKLRSLLSQAAALERTRMVEMDAARLGKFAVIYADPPWRYENPPIGGSNRSIENHYPTMEVSEICALPIADIAHENAVLFLWATSPKLRECMDVLEAWGFVYRTDMVWVKDKIGMGYHVRDKHETLLIAKRGELPPPPVESRPDSAIPAPRLAHSAKPAVFYEVIDRMYPSVRKIELFARASAERPAHWFVWGNQAAEAVA